LPRTDLRILSQQNEGTLYNTLRQPDDSIFKEDARAHKGFAERCDAVQSSLCG
jgi:hypothetical protein